MTAKDRGRHVSHCEPRLGRRPRNGSARVVASPALPPGLRPRRLPLSWGKGCSSAWLPWLRNCDEPWERFCLCALRTDFRVKPSTFSEAEMAALAAPAGGDDDDISAALAQGSSGCCLHGTGSGRRRRRGEARGARAPPPRPPGHTALPLPAPPSFSSPPTDASRPHLRAGGSWSPPRGELGGWRGQGRGRRG